MATQLKKTNTQLAFSEEEAKRIVDEVRETGYLIEHNIKQKVKHGQEYFLVKTVEELATEKDIMDQFKN